MAGLKVKLIDVNVKTLNIDILELKKIFQKIPKNWRFFFCEGLQYSPLKGV